MKSTLAWAWRLVVVAAVATTLLACQQPGDATPQPAPTVALTPSAAVAMIGDRPVSEAEWQQARAYAQVTMELLAEPGAVMDENAVFNSFLEDLMIEADAAASGFTVSDERVQMEGQRIMQVAGKDSAQLQPYLDAVGLSREGWEQEMRRAVLAADYLEDVVLASVPLNERSDRRDAWLTELAARHDLSKLAEFQPPVGIGVGDLAPDFTWIGLDEQPHSLAELKGKAVILNFWATWCVPCRAEMPLLEELYQQFEADGLVVVGMDVGEDAARVQDFVQELGVSFPIGLDQEQEISRQFRVFGMPTTFFISRDGVIDYQLVGQMNRNVLLDRIAEILAAPVDF
ncbi:MAG: redoxin domain-containing protein [Caldilineales bacterium]|nr:redoxin domain-containing protein [Caldilineales bacterium]